ncbi:MAG: hypothetical protein R6U52_02350 [Kosmotogaceae bacterium]
MKASEWQTMEKEVFLKKALNAISNNKVNNFLYRLFTDLKYSLGADSYTEWDVNSNNLKLIITNHGPLVMSAALELMDQYEDLSSLIFLQACDNLKEKYIWSEQPKLNLRGKVADKKLTLQTLGDTILWGDTLETVKTFEQIQDVNISLKPEIEDILYFMSIVSIEETTFRNARNLGHKAIALEKTLGFVERIPKLSQQFYRWFLRYLTSFPVIFPLYDRISRNFDIDEKWANSTVPIDEKLFDSIYNSLYYRKGINTEILDSLRNGYSLESIRKSLFISALKFVSERRMDTAFYLIHLINYLHSSKQYFQRHSTVRTVYALLVQALYTEIIFDERGGSGSETSTPVSESIDDILKKLVKIDASANGGHNIKFVSTILDERHHSPAWANDYFLKATDKVYRLNPKSYNVLEFYNDHHK